jgi:hypothetical protein
MEYKPLPVSDALMEETYGVPTVTINRFIMNTAPNSFRIALGESKAWDAPIHWRLAIKLTPFEAFEMKRVLETLLEPFKDHIDEVLQANEAAEKAADTGSKDAPNK